MATESLLLQLQKSDGEWLDVGHLNNAGNSIWFEFNDSYWDLPYRPVLGQTFEEQGRNWRATSRLALPNWFSHLLPEGRLRQAVATVSDTDTRHEFSLIKRLGISDLPGASRLVPTDRKGNVDLPLVSELEEEYEEGDPLLKFSLAGAQLKFSVYGKQGKGITVPASGQAGNVILKFPDGRPGFAGVPEAELGCLRLAKASGLSVAEGILISPHEVKGLEDWAEKATGLALAVHRFDRREDDVRVHMEEFAQIIRIPTSDENAKYNKASFELIAILTEAMCGTDAVGEVIDRIVLNALVGNGDAHLKNWAILYRNGRVPMLSPLYDVLPTVLYIKNDGIGLNLNKSILFEDVSAASFRRIGRKTRFGADEAEARASEAAARIIDKWNILGEYLDEAQFNRLTKRLSFIPLGRDAM